MNIYFLLMMALGIASWPAGAASISEEVRAQLREHLKNPAFALDGKAEYVITDPPYIEAALDHALKYVDLTQALAPAKLADAKRSAEVYYRNRQTGPAGLRALEALIAKRYAKPVATFKTFSDSKGAEWVELDFGWMTGPLTTSRRHRIVHDHFETTGAAAEINAQKRLHFEERGPATAQLARALADASTAYPSAARVSIVIKFPNFRLGGSALRATYYRAGRPEFHTGWVTVTSTTAASPMGQVWVKNGDFSPYVKNRYSFYIDCNPAYLRGRPPRVSAQAAQLRQKCWNHAEGVF